MTRILLTLSLTVILMSFPSCSRPGAGDRDLWRARSIEVLRRPPPALGWADLLAVLQGRLKAMAADPAVRAPGEAVRGMAVEDDEGDDGEPGTPDGRNPGGGPAPR